MTDMVQGSPEWLAARCGKVTASRVGDITARLKKGGFTAARDAYLRQVAAERLTGYATQHFVSAAMLDGSEREPAARADYAFRHRIEVVRMGFIQHPTIAMCGASPDGLVGADGGVEFKCPKAETHIGWVLDGVVPEEHLPQIDLNLACSGREWWDFVSYDGRFPDVAQAFERRVYRIERAAEIAAMEADILTFLAEVSEVVARVAPPPMEGGPDA